MPNPLSRRDLLKAAPAAVVASQLMRTASAQAPLAAPPAPGMVVRMATPQNLESNFAELQGATTPTEQFYIRSHFAVPKIDPANFQLTIEGAVENPLTLSLADLKAMPQVTMPITLECAGNGRVFLVPASRGLQWQFGGVGQAEWTGVSLATLLEKAKVKPDASEVIMIGADKGQINSDPGSPGPINYDRSIPLQKAMKPELLLAHTMNGQPLTPSHGFPLRAVVGGWYGMAAVKWLTRIVVTKTPYNGFWQTYDYAYFERRDGGLPTLTPVTAMQPKSQFIRPAIGEVVPAAKPYTLRGTAWAGEAAVGKVEVSTDAGATWTNATLVGTPKPFAWTEWTATWTPTNLGPATLLTRCTDAAGKSQPPTRDPDRRTYLINHPIPVEVLVK